MASSTPMVNGDLSRGSPPGTGAGTLEDTLQQMNTLIKENRDLKGVQLCLEGEGTAFI